MRILASASVFSLFFLLFSCQNQPSGTDAVAPADNASGNAANSAPADPAASPAAAAPVAVENLPVVREDRVIKPMEALSFSQALAAKPNIIILDLRSPSDFKMGHIARAVNMPADEPGFENKVSGLGLGNDIALYCNNGSVSMNVANQMKAMGFVRVFHLHGGLSNWAAAKLPLQQ